MKNKTPIILAMIAFVLLTIAIPIKLANLFTEDTYTVTVRYVVEGEEKPFKVYSEKHIEGEQIYLKSPEKDGYRCNKETIYLTVDSDINLTVMYECPHEVTYTNGDNINSDYICYFEGLYCTQCNKELDAHYVYHEPLYSDYDVSHYPNDIEDGLASFTCKHCGNYRSMWFTKLTATIDIGGEELKDMYFNAAGDVYNGYTYTGGEFVLLKNYASELDCIFNGIDMSQENWADGLTVNIEYDGWNETVAFCQDHLADIPETFKVRFGNNWRIIMHYSPHVSGNLKSWLNSDSCPLRTSPLRITVTYDFTK